MRDRREVLDALTAGVIYIAIGLSGWRLAAWIASLIVFLYHLWRSRSAIYVALAVAGATLVLAIVGPVRSHWNEPTIGRTALLSVVLWPVLTGVPAFGVAWIVRRLAATRTRA